MRLIPVVESLVVKGKRFYFLEILGFLSIGFLFLHNAVVYKYPFGYSGLYQLSTELLIQSKFALPASIPFYGPGGIPFTYPPLGFYIAACLESVFRIPALSYVRFAPPVWSLLAILVFYLFAFTLTKSRFQAFCAAIIFSTSAEVFTYHATAAGIVRAPALLWMLIALIGLWKLLIEETRSWGWIVFCAFFIALTGLTHFAYLFFLVISALILLLSKGKAGFFIRLGNLSIGAFLAVAIASPWWIVVLSRYGINAFLNAAQTHGTMGITSVSAFLTPFISFFSYFSSLGDVPQNGLVFLALFYLIMKRRYLFPLWFLGVILTIGESERFLILIGALMVSVVIYDLFHPIQPIDRPIIFQSRRVFLITSLFGVLWCALFFQIAYQQPALNSQLEEAANWLRTHSAPNDRYAYYSSDHDSAEWLPYLAQRQPILGHWGAEWLGTYQSKYDKWKHANSCFDHRSFSCFEKIIKSENFSYQFLVAELQSPDTDPPISDRRFLQVFKNEKYIIYQKID